MYKKIPLEPTKITILEPTEEAADKYGWLHGAETVVLTQEHIDALLSGQMLAWNDGEYVTYLLVDPAIPLETPQIGPQSDPNKE
jgi:hypothetical protein